MSRVNFTREFRSRRGPGPGLPWSLRLNVAGVLGPSDREAGACFKFKLGAGRGCPGPGTGRGAGWGPGWVTVGGNLRGPVARV
eukprot:2660750-Rhodomonas_salina.1